MFRLCGKTFILFLCAALLAPGRLWAQQPAVAVSTAPSAQAAPAAVTPVHMAASARKKEEKKRKKWVGWFIGIVLAAALVALVSGSSHSGGGSSGGGY